MPDSLAGAEAPDRDAILDHIRYHVDFRMAFDKAAARLLYRRPIQAAKAPAEGDQIVVIEVLAPDHNDEVIQPCLINESEVVFVDLAEINTLDFRAERAACRSDRKS